MCLEHNSRRTKNYKRRKTPIIAYKVCKLFRGKLYAPYRDELIYIDPNTLEYSTKSSVGAKKDSDGYWNEGIHAFLEKQKAIDLICEDSFFSKFVARNGQIFKVKINPEDVLGVGKDGDIVAKRIYFYKEEVE